MTVMVRVADGDPAVTTFMPFTRVGRHPRYGLAHVHPTVGTCLSKTAFRLISTQARVCQGYPHPGPLPLHSPWPLSRQGRGN